MEKITVLWGGNAFVLSPPVNQCCRDIRSIIGKKGPSQEHKENDENAAAKTKNCPDVFSRFLPPSTNRLTVQMRRKPESKKSQFFTPFPGRHKRPFLSAGWLEGAAGVKKIYDKCVDSIRPIIFEADTDVYRPAAPNYYMYVKEGTN